MYKVFKWMTTPTWGFMHNVLAHGVWGACLPWKKKIIFKGIGP